MRLTRLLFFALLCCASFASLQAQSTTTATVLRPYITSISPQSLLTGVDSTVLTINGKRFQRGAAVYFNARKLTNVRIDGDSVIVAVVPAELTVNADVAVLLVENPDETKVGLRIGVGTRNTGYFFSISPSTTTATFSTFTIRILGIGFAGVPRVFLGGSELIVTSTSGTQIRAQVPASLNFPGTYTVHLVQNRIAIPVGSLTFVTSGLYASPAISRVSPSFLSSSGGNLTIEGTNFSRGVVVRLGSIQLTIVSMTSERIVATAPPNLGYFQRTFLLSVTNPNGEVAVTSWGVVTNVEANPNTTTLSPNPVTTALTLETTLDRAATLTLTLRNILGEAVLQERHTAASGRFATTLDVSALANGVYMLEVSDGTDGRWVQKVIKY